MAIGRFLPWCKKDIQFHSPQPRKTPVWHHILSILLAISFMLAGYRMWSQENMTGTLVKTRTGHARNRPPCQSGRLGQSSRNMRQTAGIRPQNHLAAYLRSIALFKKGCFMTIFSICPALWSTRPVFPWQGARTRLNTAHYVFEELCERSTPPTAGHLKPWSDGRDSRDHTQPCPLQHCAGPHESGSKVHQHT